MGHVGMSGLIAGIVAAIAREKMTGASWLLPAGAAYGFCILNRNFRFNWLQKAVDTFITLLIAFEWRQILGLVRGH